MSIRKLFVVSSLALGTGLSSTCAAIEIYICKINPASSMVGGVRTGSLLDSTGRSIGACVGAQDWQAGAKTKITDAAIKGRKLDVNAFVALSGFGCICKREPCPCTPRLPSPQPSSAASPVVSGAARSADDADELDAQAMDKQPLTARKKDRPRPTPTPPPTTKP